MFTLVVNSVVLIKYDQYVPVTKLPRVLHDEKLPNVTWNVSGTRKLLMLTKTGP